VLLECHVLCLQMREVAVNDPEWVEEFPGLDSVSCEGTIILHNAFEFETKPD
jgi:hypothetical protein